MSDFSKRYFKICGIGIGIIAIAAAAVLITTHIKRENAYSASGNIPLISTPKPTGTANSVVFHEQRSINPSAYPSQIPTPAPTTVITFNENSHINHDYEKAQSDSGSNMKYKHTCIISISRTVFSDENNESDNTDIVSNTIILSESETGFTDGETVLDILIRAIKENIISAETEPEKIKETENISESELQGAVCFINSVATENFWEYKPSNGDKIECKIIK